MPSLHETSVLISGTTQYTTLDVRGEAPPTTSRMAFLVNAVGVVMIGMGALATISGVAGAASGAQQQLYTAQPLAGTPAMTFVNSRTGATLALHKAHASRSSDMGARSASH